MIFIKKCSDMKPYFSTTTREELLKMRLGEGDGTQVPPF